MEPRLDFYKASPDAIKAMLAFSAGTEKLGLEKPLLELVKLRASQINGCAFCVDMHAADARKGGETERRLYARVRVARDAVLHAARTRRAGLDGGRDADRHARRARRRLCGARRAEFTREGAMDLTLAISMINCWNRLAISFRKAGPTPEAGTPLADSGWARAA